MNRPRSWHKPKLNPSTRNPSGKTTWHCCGSNVIKHDPWPRGAIYPANRSPGAEPSPGAMGTAVRNRVCTASCHGNVVASNAGCQRVSVHQLFLFLEPPFRRSSPSFPRIKNTRTRRVFHVKINLCSQSKSHCSRKSVTTFDWKSLDLAWCKLRWSRTDKTQEYLLCESSSSIFSYILMWRWSEVVTSSHDS